ncbi:helix-turn-helix domain-containing protein [Rhodocyclus purpureus]|uniref:helix-turn-helix domain-containing protein n=1 Tax=Rhodocyclus purpureus TaxID=1067 RepID=UPI001911B86B|nr:helix-turn-helix transcriptional regulator [Rhodocyclus purpureus]MBK5914698.1 transcriptional regulator [Rhodocyclus purpureus]
MTRIQFIERDGKREFAIMPIEIFERLATLVEDAEDVALFDAAKATDDGFRVPAAVANAILDGDSALKAWREHRGLTQEALAAQAGISKAYLCQIETGKREGSVKTLRALAKALSVALDDLRP